MDISIIVNWGTVAIWFISAVLFVARLVRGEIVMPKVIEKLLASNVPLGIVIGLGLFASAASAYFNSHREVLPWTTKGPTIVSDKNFHGGEVVLDNKLFVNCSFEDVTFVYHGTAPSDLRNPVFVGRIYLKTDNPIAKTFSGFQNRLRHQPGITVFHVYQVGANGDMTLIE